MFRPFGAGGPERVLPRNADYVPNEVLLTSTREARNDELPHYMSVAAGLAAPRSSYGDPAVDGVLAQTGARTASVTRVFVPAAEATALARDAGGLAMVAAAPIGAAYDDEEDARGLARTYRVRFDRDVDVTHLCRALEQSPAIDCARPNHLNEAYKVPSDEHYGVQWGLPTIRAEEAWDVETGHADTLVAIVDTGVDLAHPDLMEKIQGGYDCVDYQGSSGARYVLLGDYRFRDTNPADEDGHGSHCAGIAAARSDDGSGIAGVHWGGGILPVRVLFRVYDRWTGRETSVGTDADVDAGIKYAVDAGADVINLSLGGPQPSHDAVLAYAKDHGVCVVAATGNENTSAPSFPASNPNVLAVGAVDQALARASFSNYGPAYNRFVVAPGVDIGSTYKDGGYVYLQGTSMATPFVAGVAALMISLARRSGHTLSPEDVYEIIRSSAQALGTGQGDLFFGDGLVDAAAALEAVRQRITCGAETATDGAVRKRAKARTRRRVRS